MKVYIDSNKKGIVHEAKESRDLDLDVTGSNIYMKNVLSVFSEYIQFSKWYLKFFRILWNWSKKTLDRNG